MTLRQTQPKSDRRKIGQGRNRRQVQTNNLSAAFAYFCLTSTQLVTIPMELKIAPAIGAVIRVSKVSTIWSSLRM
jgi:hypothetical protein